MGRLGAERRRLSHPRRRRRRRNHGGERSSVSIMFQIKGRLVPPAALLFKSGPEGGREEGREGRRWSASMRMQELQPSIIPLFLQQ